MSSKNGTLRVLHPTDLSAGSRPAFLHALRIAAMSRAVLTVLHVDDGDGSAWSEMPSVRPTLARWGLLRDAEDTEGLVAMGLGVRKVLYEGSSPVKACLEHLEDHPTDLIVLSTHQAAGRVRWFGQQVAEPLARGAGEPTLFIPSGGKGFVEPATGTVDLKRILVPVAITPHPQRALEMAIVLVERLQLKDVMITLLHVGEEASAPIVDLPSRNGVTFARVARKGDVVETIVHAAEGTGADLLLMSTKGHDGFLDAFRGSTTERVLRAVRCPVLAVPA